MKLVDNGNSGFNVDLTSAASFYPFGMSERSGDDVLMLEIPEDEINKESTKLLNH